MRVIDPGHLYTMAEQGSQREQYVTFLKRSGKVIKHKGEHPGVLTQEVLRVLIDRTKYLNDLIPCTETQDAIYYLRMALYCYELRAYRRKLEKANRQDTIHDDTERVKPWRLTTPFSEYEIEKYLLGEDGHIAV